MYEHSQGKVEHKARSVLAALYSMRDIDLLFLKITELKRCTCVPPKKEDAWRRFWADIYYYYFPPLDVDCGLWL